MRYLLIFLLLPSLSLACTEREAVRVDSKKEALKKCGPPDAVTKGTVLHYGVFSEADEVWIYQEGAVLTFRRGKRIR